MQQQLRTYAEHKQHRAASPSPAPEPRGRKISTTKRLPNLHIMAGSPSSATAISPPTSFPHQVLNTWRKNRNSSSSIASSDAPVSSSSPRVSEEHERGVSTSSSRTQPGVDSVRSNGTGGSSSQDSSSAFYSSDGSQVSRSHTPGARGLVPTSASYIPSSLSSNATSTTTPATPTNPVLSPVAESPPSLSNDTHQAEHPKKKQKGADSGSSCIMQ